MRIHERLQFNFERETKNTVRYTELTKEDIAPVIGTLYIQKVSIASYGGFPNTVYVTLEIDEE